MLLDVLLVCFSVVSVGSAASCGALVNPSFEDANTVAPWLVNSFNGGADWCPNVPAPDPLQCELRQQQALSGSLNSGRISVGRSVCRCNQQQTECTAKCQGYGVQGRNIYQDNVKVCPGMVFSAKIGRQDSRNGANPNPARVDMQFDLVIAPNADSLLNGSNYIVASQTLQPPTGPGYNNLIQGSISGVWNGNSVSCQTVGIRISQDLVVDQRVRSFVDDFRLLDVTAPIITARNVYTRAAVCGGTANVILPSCAEDNCGGTVTVVYNATLNGVPTTWAQGASQTFPVGCHDVTITATDDANNVATKTISVCVKNPRPVIVCQDIAYSTDRCHSNTTEQGVTHQSRCGTDAVTYYTRRYAPTDDLSSILFYTGINFVGACIESDNGIGGTDRACCHFKVRANLCCVAQDGDGEDGQGGQQGRFLVESSAEENGEEDGQQSRTVRSTLRTLKQKK